MVDFDEPWCAHETMEESAWIDFNTRAYNAALEKVIDDVVHQAAKDLEKK
jgi:hypothetical protein